MVNVLHGEMFWRSTLGPLIFLIYISDLTADLECNVKLFADDTSLFMVVHDPNDASEKINHDLEKINHDLDHDQS